MCGPQPRLPTWQYYSIKDKNMQASLAHFRAMIGPHGLYQHATGQEPLLREGYCTDDNARAVQLLVEWLTKNPGNQAKELETLLQPCWQFLVDAKRPDGTFYNFRSAKGEWLANDISDDMYARLARACTTVIRYDRNSTRQQEATALLTDLEPLLQNLTALRGWAETIIALALLPTDAKPFNIAALATTNTKRLLETWESAATPTWPWFEPVMTYANALIPQSLLAAKSIVEHPELETVLEKSTDFLITSTIRDGIFIPIGSVGWYPQGGQPAIDNQQPIEAGTMFEFLLAYHKVFPDHLSRETILAPYLWFFGANTGKVVLANPAIGASYDGLFLTGPNVNYGAESMLAYLTAELLLATAPADLQSAAKVARENIQD